RDRDPGPSEREGSREGHGSEGRRGWGHRRGRAVIAAGRAAPGRRGYRQSDRGEGPARELCRETEAGMRAFLLACLVLATSSCGYALAGRGNTLPSSIKIIGVPQFTNRSIVPNVDLVVTDAV